MIVRKSCTKYGIFHIMLTRRRYRSIVTFIICDARPTLHHNIDSRGPEPSTSFLALSWTAALCSANIFSAALLLVFLELVCYAGARFFRFVCLTHIAQLSSSAMRWRQSFFCALAESTTDRHSVMSRLGVWLSIWLLFIEVMAEYHWNAGAHIPFWQNWIVIGTSNPITSFLR